MIKYFRPLFIIVLFLGNLSQALPQEYGTEKSYYAKPTAKVFANIFSGINQGNNPTAIEIKRAYIGYDIKLKDGFSSKIILDIGSPDNSSAYSLLKRYAYFKSAYLQYETGKFNFKFGIIPMQLFKIQEKIWGHRYIEKSATDKYKFGTSSDLGISANYKVTSFAEIDITLSNGEGNATEQQDNGYKAALGITLKPLKGITIRTYADIISKAEDQITLVNFIGYQIDEKLSVGLEYDKQLNIKNVADENLAIFSGTASYQISNKFQLFGRYDILRSNTLPSETYNWNSDKDGNAIIGGIQYSPISQIRMAINYREWIPFDELRNNESFVYFNIEFGL